MALLRTELDRLDPSVTTDAFVGKGMDKDGDLLVVGSKIGEIYVFQHDTVGSGVEDDTWTKIATLNMPSGQQADSVAIHANKIAAGGAGGTDGVALWLEPSGGWADKAAGLEDAYLTALNGDPIGQTPESVVIHEENVIASYPGLNSPTAPHGGRAYVYKKHDPTEILWGTSSDVFPVSNNVNAEDLDKLDTDKVIITASAFVSGVWKQLTRVGSLSDFDITYGAEVLVRTGNMSVGVSALTPSTAVLISQGPGNAGEAVVASISGLGVTLGSASQYSGAQFNFCTVNKIDSTRFIVAYPGAGAAGALRIGEVSGTTITYGPEFTYETLNGTQMLDVIDASTFVLTYSTGGGVFSVVGSVSGTTILSIGTKTAVAATGLDANKVTKLFDTELLDSTRFMIATQYNTGGGVLAFEGRAVVGSISGTTITFGTAIIFTDSENMTADAVNEKRVAISLLGNDQGVIVYKKSGGAPNKNSAFSTVFNTSGTTISLTTPAGWVDFQIVGLNTVRLSGTRVCGLIGQSAIGTPALGVYVGEFASKWINTTETQILTGSDTDVRDRFGASMDIRHSDGTLIVGASAKGTEVGHGHGGAYIFSLVGTLWSELQKLDPVDLVNTDAYGKFVGINETVVAILSQRDIADLNSIDVHREGGGFFSLESTFNPTPNDSADYMVLDADVEKLLIHDALNPSTPGSVLLYAAVSGVWSNDVTLVPNVVPALSTFGKDLQLSSGIAYVGDSTFDPDIGGLDNNGVVYVYDVAIAEAALITIDDLIAEVVAIGLSAGLQKSYLAKLRHVQRVLNSNKSDELIALVAINMLSAFANHVEAQRNKALTDGEATSLIDGAESLSAQLLQ